MSTPENITLQEAEDAVLMLRLLLKGAIQWTPQQGSPHIGTIGPRGTVCSTTLTPMEIPKVDRGTRDLLRAVDQRIKKTQP